MSPEEGIYLAVLLASIPIGFLFKKGGECYALVVKVGRIKRCSLTEGNRLRAMDDLLLPMMGVPSPALEEGAIEDRDFCQVWFFTFLSCNDRKSHHAWTFIIVQLLNGVEESHLAVGKPTGGSKENPGVLVCITSHSELKGNFFSLKAIVITCWRRGISV